ncbi:hypothetical protein [Nonomuraea basaltis]|uniref:hypothetical protein n=1 Tax=Nonomuraea basaltis TaxID=2495887 RepID=UPI00110C4AC8|nr:hypothetical protein [Nonomuraea basaltis]TMR92127.1 hypothetical protein EJK15_46415 [Nonomuraea basaltis]
MGKIEIKAKGLGIVVHRDGRPIGRVWWSTARERYIAGAMSGTPIGEHPLRTTAIDMVAENAAVTEITDEIAQQVADAIGKHFVGDRDYWPQMDADWDGGDGRVIVWMHGLPDWAYLVRYGGMSDYDCPDEYARCRCRRACGSSRSTRRSCASCPTETPAAGPNERARPPLTCHHNPRRGPR